MVHVALAMLGLLLAAALAHTRLGTLLARVAVFVSLASAVLASVAALAGVHADPAVPFAYDALSALLVPLAHFVGREAMIAFGLLALSLLAGLFPQSLIGLDERGVHSLSHRGADVSRSAGVSPSRRW